VYYRLFIICLLYAMFLEIFLYYFIHSDKKGIVCRQSCVCRRLQTRKFQHDSQKRNYLHKDL